MDKTQEFLADLKQQIVKNLHRAGITLVNAIKVNISISGSPHRSASRKGIYYRNAAPSAPGDFPKKEIGNLMRSISYSISDDGLTLYVGSSLPYAGYLELGSQKMAPRPFLRRTLNENLQKISAIISARKV